MSWRWSKLGVGKTTRKGQGLFALLRPIQRGEVLFYATGREVRDIYDERYRLGQHWLAIGRGCWLVPPRRYPLYFINHSCDPNAGLKGTRTFVAMRAIRKGEEITFDYSTSEEDPFWHMHCRCGAPCCRKIIRSIEFLPPTLFRKYRQFIPSYLRRRYEKYHSTT
jgi:hypothetical protein